MRKFCVFGKLTCEHNNKNTSKLFCFVGVYDRVVVVTFGNSQFQIILTNLCVVYLQM